MRKASWRLLESWESKYLSIASYPYTYIPPVYLVQATDYSRSSRNPSRLNYAYLKYYNQPPSQYSSALYPICPKISTLPPPKLPSHSKIPPISKKPLNPPLPNISTPRPPSPSKIYSISPIHQSVLHPQQKRDEYVRCTHVVVEV